MLRKVIFIALAAFTLIPRQADARERLQTLDTFGYVVTKGILTAMVAKEMCSCRYVVGLPLKTCMARNLLPGAAFSMLVIEEKLDIKSISVTPKAFVAFGPPAEATFNSKSPRKGCRITYGALEWMEDWRRDSQRDIWREN